MKISKHGQAPAFLDEEVCQWQGPQWVPSAFRKDENVSHEDDEIVCGLITAQSISGAICGVREAAALCELHLRALEPCTGLS